MNAYLSNYTSLQVFKVIKLHYLEYIYIYQSFPQGEKTKHGYSKCIIVQGSLISFFLLCK